MPLRFNKILPQPRLERIIFFTLAALFIAFLIFLLEARTPWDSRITKRLAEGKNLLVRDYITIGSWWAALVNLCVTAVLLFTSRLWMPLLASAKETAAPLRQGRGWWLGIAGAMLLCAVLCWPRMSLSLWGDEEYSLRQVILGNYKYQPDGEPEFYRYSFAENLWNYKGPNNHFLFTIFARISTDVWLKFADNPDLPFNETALRLPALIAGLLCLPAIALLLARMGFPLAGIFAAYFMAIHPWFIKYASEARGYSLMLLFAILASHTLLEALRREKLRWWLAFAFCNFCIIYAYPAAMYLVFTLGLAALALTLSDKGFTRVALAQITRLAFSGALAGMLCLQLIAPAVPQMMLWLQRDRAKGEQGLAWLLDFWGYLSTGMAWEEWAASNPLAHTVRDLHGSLFYWFVLILIPLTALIGLFRFVKGNRVHAALAAAWVIAPALGWLQAALSGNILYLWYLIYALPAFVVFIALGLSSFRRAASILCFLIFSGLYIKTTATQIRTLQNHAVEPQRDSVLLTRPTLNTFAEENKRILTANVTFGTRLYDPRQVELKSKEHLMELMEESDRVGWPLFLNFGSEGFSRFIQPETMDLIENSGRFELVKRLYGLEEQNTRVVYRYKGAD